MASKEASGEIVPGRNRNLEKTYLCITGNVLWADPEFLSREKGVVRGIFRFATSGVVVVVQGMEGPSHIFGNFAL